MNTVQQDQANLEAITREVASEKAVITSLQQRLKEATEIGNREHIEWAQREIEEHQEVLKAAENILAEEAGVAAPRARRGRPPLQKRAE